MKTNAQILKEFENALAERFAEFLRYIDPEDPTPPEEFKHTELWEVCIEGFPEDTAHQIIADAKKEVGL